MTIYRYFPLFIQADNMLIMVKNVIEQKQKMSHVI